MDKVGCAFYECESPQPRFVSFVCKYGGSDVKPETLLYLPGKPCQYCPEDCVSGSLCYRHKLKPKPTSKSS
ncbi:hypothetical protein DICVIV_14084 [Dictyocaulus viviparus]|uniref:Uncharacterized protein n=1 Tax=Dictyocaulus viviparus TaxID=29172 RepID=A0A0D8X672_DICVI|nr:hypothetical protein DICVIV_14084 [Dictyocaulus viviparus]